MIGHEYAEFLESFLADVPNWGIQHPGVLRQLENATERLLLAPARVFESSGASESEILAEQQACNDRLRPFWKRGPFGNEITHWPAGPGSARAMELVYSNEPPRNDSSSHYTEWFLLTRDLAHAVRSRRDVLRELLTAELNTRPGAVQILDLACGPCRSLREALPQIAGPERIALRAVDTDAPMQAQNRAFFGQSQTQHWNFEVANVLRIDLGEGVNDIVYSTGLYDYLPSDTLAALWRRVYAWLAPGGLAILSVKDGSRFCPLLYRWAVPWSQFLIRVEGEFQQIMQQAGLPKPTRVMRDGTGCILFYLIRKPN